MCHSLSRYPQIHASEAAERAAQEAATQPSPVSRSSSQKQSNGGIFSSLLGGATKEEDEDLVF